MSLQNIQNMTDREVSILTAVIEGYIENGTPISSSYIEMNCNLNVSSATIRTEMALLEEKGYLTQLHTSGGRVPTDLGYRFYVNSIKLIRSLDNAVTKDIEHELLTISNNVDELLNATALMLARVSHMFSVVTISGYQQSILTDIELVSIQGDRVMLVLAMDTGIVKSIVLNLDIIIDSKLIKKTTQLLKDRLVGLCLKEIQNSIVHRLQDTEIFTHELVQVLVNERAQYFTIDSNKSIYTSSSDVLLIQPEFQDLSCFQRLLPALDKKFLNKYFKDNFTFHSEPTLIGKENGDARLNECAIITTHFESGTIKGRIGVLGPKRISYMSMHSILHKFTEIIQSAIQR